MDKKELKANQKYEKVIEKVQKTETKLFELREKKRKLDKTYPSQNSDNLMGNHVAEYLKDQSDFINKNKES